MKNIAKFPCQTAIALTALLSLCSCGKAQPSPASPGSATYDQLVVNANTLLKDGKLDDARQTAQQAIQQDANRYEGYVLASKIASQQGKTNDALQFANKALALAPDDRKAQVQQLASMLAPPGVQSPSASLAKLTDEDQLKLDALMLILDDANKATKPEDRAKAFQEFMQKSADFAIAHPDQTNLWVMRAFAAVELDLPSEGWEAGRQLKALGAIHSQDPKVRKVMAELERKSWLGNYSPTQDWKTASLESVQKAAQQGEGQAESELGYRYARGTNGVAKDNVEAVKWFRKAAEQGNSDGQYNLGVMYQNGWGVEKDYVQAVNWFRKAAEQGNSFGQNNLGVMYQYGWGVEKDYVQAVSWYRKVAEQGNSVGQDNLGWMYENGWGVEKDYVQAVSWFRKAAEQGNSDGQNNLGVMYQNGLGVEKDYVQAVSWYRKVAEQGNSVGQNHLGVMYESGWGVEKNLSEALSWYRKAAAQGDSFGAMNVTRLTASPAATVVGRRGG
jgi:TPR repeat protein